MEYLFLPATISDSEEIFALIRDRIRWMDEMGIEQWNKVDYWYAFPPSYYYAAIEEKRLYVLKDSLAAHVISAGVLTFEDFCWKKDDASAIYLHNFVTARNAKGAGDLFLTHCEQYARSHGRTIFRLDCAKSNQKLNQYYEQRGFKVVGEIIDGPFIGLKREKKF